MVSRKLSHLFEVVAVLHIVLVELFAFLKVLGVSVKKLSVFMKGGGKVGGREGPSLRDGGGGGAMAYLF